ncbi:MAG: TRAP transporter substrate-binding protein DctP [Pseudomonadota bacterium]
MNLARKLAIAGLILAASLVFAAGGQAASKLDLPMSTVYMNTHPTVVNAWIPWFKEMAKLTQGQVQISYYNPNTLTPLADHFDSTIAGTLGIGGNDISRNAGKFNLSTVMQLPGLAPGAECGSLVFWELYNRHPELQKEYSQIKLLWVWASATYQIHTTKKPVKTRADLKGMKIICWDRKTAETIQALGGNPVMVPPTDSYLALERGMADGVLCPLAPIISFKISEAVKFTTVCDIAVTGFWAGVSHDLWSVLSPEAQKAFSDTTGQALADQSGKSLDQGAVADSKRLKAAGHTFIELSEAERADWLKATTPLREKWVAEMEGKGYKNARAIMEDAYQLSAKYAKTTGRGY